MQTHDRTLTNGRYTPPRNYASKPPREPVGGSVLDREAGTGSMAEQFGLTLRDPSNPEAGWRALNEQVEEATRLG